MDKINGDEPMMPTEQYFSDGEIGNLKGGLTIRQYYAGLAMQGIIRFGFDNTMGKGMFEAIANDSVTAADKLIEALNK